MFDQQDATGTLTLQILGAVAQFERALILERQREGIEAAKRRGVYEETRKITPEGAAAPWQQHLSFLPEVYAEGAEGIRLKESIFTREAPDSRRREICGRERSRAAVVEKSPITLNVCSPEPDPHVQVPRYTYI